MFTTAVTARPLLAAVSAALAVLAASASAPEAARAAQAERCAGSLDIPSSAQELGAAANAVACLVNAERTSRGLDPLRRDAALAEAARDYAAEMARENFFAHVSPAGLRVRDRIDAAGYGRPGDGWRVGENLGWGTGARATPNALVDAWLASPPHRRIMLENAYKELGVGVAAGAPKPSPLPGATYALELGVVRPAG
jgi:uncharacterized protein YkwD